MGPDGNLHRINYEQSMQRLENISAQGYAVKAVWECDVDKQIKENPEMKEHFEDMCVRGRIEPRDAFSGGKLIFMAIYNVHI